MEYKKKYSLAKHILLLFLVKLSTVYWAQISPNSKVYLLTCNPGNEIYTQFGHSALRIVDKEAQLDMCYNWGMFEFDDNEFDFNMKFAKGQLPYYMGMQSFEGFMAEYIHFNRQVRQLELNLNTTQKNELFEALKENYLPQNRVYKYDFFFDNCASRISDFLIKIMGSHLELGIHKDANLYSYRNLITPRLDQHPWTRLGINLVLGSKIDILVSNQNLMFLPEYMEAIFIQSTINNNGIKEPFVLSQETIFSGEVSNSQKSGWFSPNLFSWSLFCFVLVCGFFSWHKTLKIFGAFILLFSSILGIVLLFMWFGTDHQATKANFNIIWANPIALFIPFVIFSEKLFQKMHQIFKIFSFSYLLFVLLWIILPQEFDLPTKGIILTQGFLFYTWQKNTKKTPQKI